MLPATLSVLPTLETPRLRLRHLTAADVPALFTVFSDPAVMRYWSSAPLVDEAAAAALLAQIHENFRTRALLQWGIEHRADGRVIGTCTLYRLDAQNRRGEVGYALAHAYWGQGLMQEAQNALIRFAFASIDVGGLDLLRLEADVDPRNAASRRSLLRLGFQREGYLRERWHVVGEVCDSELFGLLRREWTGAPSSGQ
ncbi:MAG: GNAT family N-acetyltransferase [Hymenobacteraceae bacterium]|nr:GNAT family N-acetyltransferase [Hymenobacteraceae bacterium]